MSQCISIGASDAFDRTIPPVENLAEFLGEFVITGCGDVFGYGLGGSSDVAGYTGHGIGIATKGEARMTASMKLSASRKQMMDSDTLLSQAVSN